MAQTSWPVEEFRELLDRILSKTGLSQGALAALVPMDQSQLSRWKSGGSRPKYDTLATFADAVERAHPHIGISKREILSAGGYGDTLRATPGADEADRGDDAEGRLKVIDGGGDPDTRDDEDESDETMIANFKAEIFRDTSERIMWNLVDLPEKARLAAIKGKRKGQRDAARQHQQQRLERPRENHGG